MFGGLLLPKLLPQHTNSHSAASRQKQTFLNEERQNPLVQLRLSRLDVALPGGVRTQCLRCRKSRVEATFFVGRQDALAGDHERRCAQGNAASLRGLPNLFESVENDFFEALIDLVLGPK